MTPDLTTALATTTIVARVSPEQKARVVQLLRTGGATVGFLGDGVNDSLALHAADVGISVDTATDVAKDAADVILLEKSLDVIALGVAEGRRIFANTLKYVFMAASGNFGNMISAAAASAFLPFLPMLPGQILLGNLLYDGSQLAISSDRVDPSAVRTPSRWDIGSIGRFMLVFGPLSSIFDLLTFALLLGVFHADATQFRTGWFIESLASQALVVLVIRTRHVPFVRSRPSIPLLGSLAAVVAIAVALPFTPLGTVLGFQPPERDPAARHRRCRARLPGDRGCRQGPVLPRRGTAASAASSGAPPATRDQRIRRLTQPMLRSWPSTPSTAASAAIATPTTTIDRMLHGLRVPTNERPVTSGASMVR